MASSRAMIEALGDNKNGDGVDDGMDALPTVPLPFFNRQFNFLDQQQSNPGINNLGINVNQNNNNNNNAL
jgi:hypothetical protein